MARRGRPRIRPASIQIDASSADFAEVIADWMEEHAYEVDEEVVQAAGEAANKAAQMLRERSKHYSGAYRKGWAADVQASETGVEAVVYNKRKPQLTHLLEKGHVIRNQPGGKTYGRVGGDGVIAAVEAEVSAEFEGRFKA